MLSDIRRAWPPNPGPNEPQTGTKTLHSMIRTNHKESLVGLHNPAWWTGVRLTVAGADLVDSQFRVRLLTESGLPAFGMVPQACQWVQSNRQWHPFPWPIPAAAATEIELVAEITFLDSDQPVFASIVFSFHEMTQMAVRDRYLFITEEGVVVQQWNGRRHSWGCPLSGSPPEWRTIHSVVPPMTMILDEYGWDDDVFCIHEWEERYSVDR